MQTTAPTYAEIYADSAAADQRLRRIPAEILCDDLANLEQAREQLDTVIEWITLELTGRSLDTDRMRTEKQALQAQVTKLKAELATTKANTQAAA